MTKDVLLAIKGLQFNASEEESNVETITPATYYRKNNSHFLVYDEAEEGSDKTTKNLIRFKKNSLELTKNGVVNVHMVFEENQKNLSNYATPYGDIMVGIDTKKITLADEEHKMHIEVDYALEINYEFLANCKICMDVSERDIDNQSIFER